MPRLARINPGQLSCRIGFSGGLFATAADDVESLDPFERTCR